MKILLAVDGSPCSDAAVASVSRRPWPPNSEVRIITVDSPMEFDRLRRGSPGVFDQLVERQRAEAIRRLDLAMDVLRRNAPALAVTPVIREGWPKEVILDEAERWGADLIVVGSHGHGAIRRMFLGSVSLALATNAPCSVEIARAVKSTDENVDSQGQAAAPQP